MKALLILLLCLYCCHSHIYASDSKVTYDFDGNPKIYHIYLSMETGLGASDYLKINWPTRIHASTKSDLKAKLISFSNNLEIVEMSFNTLPADTSAVYQIQFGVALTAKKWYQIQIFPTQNPSSTPFQGLIQLELISSLATYFITYDSNKAFGYVSIQAPLGTPGLMTVGANILAGGNRAGSINTITIDITPQQTNAHGGNFTLSIHYNSADTTNHNAPAVGTSGQLDFKFMGLCQSVDPGSGVAAVLNNCEISDDLTEIYFSTDSITSGTVIRIQTQVSNPLFRSTRGIRAYYVDFISGIVKESGYQSTSLSVSPIAISNLGNSRIYFLWGMDSNFATTDTNLAELNLGLFKASSGARLGPFNSFNAGFSFTQTSPIQGRYRLKMTLEAAGFLEGSIAHNLPAYSNLKVYCNYDVSSKKLVCENVGPFINTNYRYFISGKAYFTSSTPASLTTFGDVEIQPIAQDSTGSAVTVTLYTSLQPGTSINVRQSHEFLDPSGYHSQSSYKVGVAQVVSYKDDGTLSSTANAMKNLLTGTNSTIGVVPDLGSSQQLLFLLKVASSSMSGAAGNDYHMRILYNNKVIGFESGSQTRGLDFVGYSNTDSVWSIQYAPCHINGYVVCQKYNFDTPTKNTQIRMNEDDSTNFYGLYKFQCGSAYVASPTCFNSNCAQACNMFTGYGTANYKSSVMSMRKVTFNSTQYHSSLYADDSLLDFVIIYLQGTTFMSSSLINAYTMVGTKMENIKASYVNYYESNSGSYNKGTRIPMMIRISGGVLPKQSRNATAIGVFFDDNVDAKTFYNQKDESYGVGCSTANCIYYPNTGISIDANDIWHTMRRVEFYDIPPIQNQFNLLVPVTPSITRYVSDPLPDTLTIAFFTQNHTIGDVTGLLKTVSVYRLFGSAVTSTISGTLGSINSLAKRSSAYFTSDFTSSSVSSYASSVTYYLNTSNINLNPPNNTFIAGYSTSTPFTINEQYGCGVTFTSLYYNIFQSSTLAFEDPPANTALTCTIFGYIYNQQVSGNAERNGQWIYTVFCPIDGSINLNSANGNIQFYNPQYPDVFTYGFFLRGVLTYGISDPQGYLVHYKHDANSIPSSFIRVCTTAKLHPYNPTSSGKQRATFTISTPQIRMSKSGLDGFLSFRVRITLPGTASNINMQNLCDIYDPDLSCTASGSSTTVVATVTYIGSSVMTVTYFELDLYAITSGNLGTQGDYTLRIQLPQRDSSNEFVPFGTSYSNSIYYSQCTSTFKIGTTPYQTQMVYQTPVLLSSMQTAKSPIQFNFGSLSYRETFFSTSYFEFHFGFLQNQVTATRSANNLRCMVYENNGGVLTLTEKWNELTFNSYPTVRLYSKQNIDDPASTLFTMKCNGAGVPTGPSNQMTLKWKDGTYDVQTATSISSPTYTTILGSYSTSPSIQKKRFRTQGMKGFYTFQLAVGTALDENSRIYFDFNLNLNSKLDRQGVVQCYIRATSTTTDADAIFSYCEFTYDHQLVIWNNVEIASSTLFFIDIFNIEQPLSSNTSPNVITVSLDLDSDYSNGIYALATVSDSAPDSTSISNILITKTSMNTTYIRSPQTITIQFNNPSVIASNQFIYLLLPALYGQWINRGQTLDATTDQCYIQNIGTPGTNIINQCIFISKRILKMKFPSGAGASSLKLIINNVFSPSKIPNGRYNQYRFKLFTANAAETTLVSYSFTDHSKFLTLQPDSNLIDLSWKYHTVSIVNSLVSLTDASENTFIVNVGYYSNYIELSQSLHPLNFKAQLELALSLYSLEDDIIIKDGAVVKLGTKNAYFRFAAKSTSTLISAGLYTLQFSSTGDDNNQYTQVPPLTIVVSNKKCKLVTEQVSYPLPLGGFSLPIRISAVSCIPINNITITLTYDNVEVQTDADLSSSVLDPALVDGQLYFVAKHISRGALSIGGIVTITFAITGSEASSYDIIPSITMTMVDPLTYQTLPTATALSTPTLSYNKATFTLQCSMASKIYWGLGIYPSILNNQALDFQARILSNQKGLLTNFTQPQDYFMKVYGLNYVKTTQTFQKNLYNLKSNSQYIFKYYCINQMGMISDGQSLTFVSLNYGAYLMKISITFRGSINYGQYRDLACSLAQSFQIPYNRIMTQVMSSCQVTSTIFYANLSSIIQNDANSNGQYVYNFYVLPDYSIAIDNTNSDIRSALSLSSTSTSIITSTNNFINLPETIQMQTQDIQFFTTPTLSVSDPLSGLNSIIITSSITNMNGFIIMGCMDGVFDPSSMTVPKAINIKKGLFSQNQPLKKVKMLYSIQNYNVTVQFSDMQANKQYTCFYFATGEDPELTAAATTVSRFNAKTLEALSVDINWESGLLKMGYYLSLAFIGLLVFML